MTETIGAVILYGGAILFGLMSWAAFTSDAGRFPVVYGLAMTLTTLIGAVYLTVKVIL